MFLFFWLVLFGAATGAQRSRGRHVPQNNNQGNDTPLLLPQSYAIRHSFRPPFQPGRIPFFNLGAGASITQGEQTKVVRLTPAKQSRTGFAWNTLPVTMVDWEVILDFKVTGRTDLGGDGFAFWFVDKPEIIGPVYGSADFWQGVGVFFDTFNNDGSGLSPLVTIVENDGTQKFDQGSDGESQALATCSFAVRNPDAGGTAVRIRYQNEQMHIDYSVTKDSMGNPTWQSCVSGVALTLGVDKFFGLTAHTGDLADAHDILSFTAVDLTASGADLRRVRETYNTHLQRSQANEGHQEMSPGQFQHSVLTLLNQMQGEVNTMELSSFTSFNELIRTTKRILEQAGGGEGGSATGGAIDNSQLGAMAQNLANIARDMESLRMKGGGSTAGGPTQGDLTRLTTRLNSVAQDVGSMKRQVSDVLSAINKLSNRQEQASELGSNGDGGGSVSWLVVLLLVLVLCALAALAFSVYKKKGDEWETKRV